MAGVSACRPWPRTMAIQYWRSEIALLPSLPPEVRAQSEANVALSLGDVETAVTASVPVIVSPKSHCYLDVPYAESSANPGQAERRGRVGQRVYSPKKSPSHSIGNPPKRSAPVEPRTSRGRSRDLDQDDRRFRRSVLPAVASACRRRTQGLEQPTSRRLDRPPRSSRSTRPTVGARRPHVLPHLRRGLALASSRRLFDENGMPAFGTKRTSRKC